ncbi:hypothetical protein VTI74DRAFT_6366 [Chaetomium olivicolor]
MQLQNIALLVAVGLAHVQAASVPTSNGVPLVPVYSRVVGNGTLSFWGLPGSDKAASTFDWEKGWGEGAAFVYPTPSPSVQRRCGSNQVHCATSNYALTTSCEELINVLWSNPGGWLPDDVRVISYASRPDLTCAISWYNRVPNNRYAYLIPAAQSTFENCKHRSATGGVTGYATDVNLNGVCTVQCLSNALTCFS